MISRKLLEDLLRADLNERSLEGAEAFPPTKKDRVFKFAKEYQLASLNRKASDGTVSSQHISASLEKFFSIQQDMRDLNENWHQVEEAFASKIRDARDIIHRLLPPLEFVEDEIWPLCTFGPGTFHGAIKGNIGHSLHFKIGGAQTVTPRAKALSISVIRDYFPNWAQHLAERSTLATSAGNRLSHVVKDTRSCRPIAIEPSLNVFLQQGVGRYLGRLMRQRGFADIYGGQAVQRSKASCLGNATIDLSSASDTISLALCEALIPADWWELLLTIRSPSWSYRDQQGTYANVSSQGNAFTFPLETMIFKSVVMAFTGLPSEDVTVYGDDIIVPIDAAFKAAEGLEACGFVVNKEKSFFGQHDCDLKYFRESCGADYFFGELVTPVYYRKNAEHPSEVAALHNRLIETWGYLPRVTQYLLSCVPEKLRLFGPKEFITDNPERWLSRENFFRPMGAANTVVRTYSNWFWSEEESSSHMWLAETRKMSPRSYISDRTAILTFLFGDSNTVPRSGRIRKRRKPNLTASSESLHTHPLRGEWRELIFPLIN